MSLILLGLTEPDAAAGAAARPEWAASAGLAAASASVPATTSGAAISAEYRLKGKLICTRLPLIRACVRRAAIPGLGWRPPATRRSSLTRGNLTMADGPVKR